MPSHLYSVLLVVLLNKPNSYATARPNFYAAMV